MCSPFTLTHLLSCSHLSSPDNKQLPAATTNPTRGAFEGADSTLSFLLVTAWALDFSGSSLRTLLCVSYGVTHSAVETSKASFLGLRACEAESNVVSQHTLCTTKGLGPNSQASERLGL